MIPLCIGRMEERKHYLPAVWQKCVSDGVRSMLSGIINYRKHSNPYSENALAPFRAIVFLLFLSLWSGPVFGAENIDECSPGEVKLYLALARASELSYDDSQPGLESTPSGCVALVREDDDGNLVIAFRGSLIGDRNPKHPFSNLSGANIRRNYRDWVATNLKQTAGFLPRQYTEAASLVEKYVDEHPADKLLYITGHSKGGGAATYAYVAVSVSPNISVRKVQRMRCVTFNAAVVREQNWSRLFRRFEHDNARTENQLADASVCALVMADDPVSKIAASEERRYVKRIVIAPAAGLNPYEQHGIGVVADALESLVERFP